MSGLMIRGSPVFASGDDALAALIILGSALFVMFYRWRPRVGGSFGNASWATDRLLRAWGMLGECGLILGRTLGGALIRLPRYTHLLLIGATGAG